MVVRNILVVFVVACATTACAFDTTPDASDTTVASVEVPPINTGAPRDGHAGPACTATVKIGANGELIVTGYLCPPPEMTKPNPEVMPTADHQDELERGLSARAAR